MGYYKLHEKSVSKFLLELVDLKHTTDDNKKSRQSQTEKHKYDLKNIKLLLRSTLNLLNCATEKCVLFKTLKQEDKYQNQLKVKILVKS